MENELILLFGNRKWSHFDEWDGGKVAGGALVSPLDLPVVESLSETRWVCSILEPKVLELEVEYLLHNAYCFCVSELFAGFGHFCGLSLAFSEESKNMSCLVDECNFLNPSFFFSSLSRVCSNWRERSLFCVFALSYWWEMLAASCWRIASFVVGAVPGAKIGGGPEGSAGERPKEIMRFAGAMQHMWHLR